MMSFDIAKSPFEIKVIFSALKIRKKSTKILMQKVDIYLYMKNINIFRNKTKGFAITEAVQK